MSLPDFPAIASRLCADCGLCCNGVMFHTVRLQAGDSAKALAALGLRLKRKQGKLYLQQPCPAFRASCCAIYAARPERCRLFECQQLRRVAAGEITEAMARETIGLALRQVSVIEAMLAALGGAKTKHPLSKRCETALAEPVDSRLDPAGGEARREFTRAVRELEALLNQEFRLIPTQAGGEPGDGEVSA